MTVVNLFRPLDAHSGSPAGRMRLPLLLLVIWLAFCGAASAFAAAKPGGPRVVHVVVALCDNQYQGIIPVPPAIGNGQNPGENLYWGAAYGIKTFLSRQAEWMLHARVTDPAPHVLERLVFQLKGQDVYLVADAWDGAYIKDATVAFLEYAAGRREESVCLAIPPADAAYPVDPACPEKKPWKPGSFPDKLRAGGQAGLIVYVGHNGLMDFSLDAFPQHAGTGTRDAAVFACLSREYFLDPLQQAGARPLILTKSLMCPEAYSTHALVLGWAAGEKPAALRERIAAAYSRYQKCSLKGARSVFAAGE